MSRAIVSMGTGPQVRLLRIASDTVRPYAERHGYELELHTETVETGRPAAWAKVQLLRDLVQRHDLVVWLDADLVVTNGRPDIADALPRDRLMGLVEHETRAGAMPNTGVWMLRGGPEAVALLDEVWAQTDLVEHRWWENAALCRLLGYDLDLAGPPAPTGLLRDRTTFIDARWNSIPDAPAPRPFIRHYPGYAVRTRTAFMARDTALARARRLAGRW